MNKPPEKESPSGGVSVAKRIAQKVIRLVTGTAADLPSAGTVKALTSVQLGLIPLIYFTTPRWHPPHAVTKEIRPWNLVGTIATLRAIYGLLNVRFSVVSVKSDRILICASYYNGTSGFPPDRLSLPGSPDTSSDPTVCGPDDGPPKPNG